MSHLIFNYDSVLHSDDYLLPILHNISTNGSLSYSILYKYDIWKVVLPSRDFSVNT